MLSLPVEVLLVVAAVLVLLYQGWALLLAAEMPRLDPAPRAEGAAPGPKVSVVIAAKNEELELDASLTTLLRQDYDRFDVIVVDGRSSDGTRSVAERGGPRVRCLEEPLLPTGWVGKNWACWNGARATDGNWLLFMDADVRLHPTAIRTTLEWALREKAALATIAPRVEMVGFWERVILPFYVQMVLAYFRAPHVNRPSSRSAMANGQYWLVRRKDYEELGGHESVRSFLLEDVAIARRFRAAGKRLRVAWTPALAVTRMYRDRREMFEGILKNIHGTDFSAARQTGFLVALVGLFWLPLGVLPLGVLAGDLPIAGLGAFLYFALFGKHAVFARAVGAPAAYGLLYPLAVGFYIVAVATSLVRGLRGGTVTWKGRAYPVRGSSVARSDK
jgi:chlorobactene glucosyltransferase